jgi:hypothetical protein
MKKLMIVALMAIVATTAFAGDSPTLKSILKAKTYAEAESLLKSGLSQLASPAEKAKAYNKLVDLALDTFTKQQAVATSNQMAEQYGQGKVEQYDTLAMYNSIVKAFQAAEECEKYDVMPDAKGKVKPAFHAKNVQRLVGHRAHLINGGIFYQDKVVGTITLDTNERKAATRQQILFQRYRSISQGICIRYGIIREKHNLTQGFASDFSLKRSPVLLRFCLCRLFDLIDYNFKCLDPYHYLIMTF